MLVPFLTTLDMPGSRITDKGLQSLSAFKTLKRLNLARTRVTSDGVKKPFGATARTGVDGNSEHASRPVFSLAAATSAAKTSGR